jgi:hypothetical protein
LFPPRKRGLALVLFRFSQEMTVGLGFCAMPSAVQKNMHFRRRRAISEFDAHGGFVESEKIKRAEAASLAK